MKRKLLLPTIALLTASLLSGCSTVSANQALVKYTYVFQVGHVVTTDHSYHKGLLRFSELVGQKTNGRVKIEIFPSAQIGNEADLTEGVAMGTVDMALVNSGNLASFINTYQLFDLPFLFRDEAHAHSVLDGEIGQAALGSLGKIGIKGFANWENGFFSLWNNERPINKAEDFKGLKIRANNNPIHLDSYKAMGASPITMGWSEVYSAIQNGTIDGVSVSIPSMYSAKIHEVAPYLSTSSEFYVTVILMMNLDLYNKLPADIQTALVQSAVETTSYQRELNAKLMNEELAELEKNGFQVTHPDKEQIKQMVWDVVYDKWADKLGKDKIKSIQEDY